MEKTMDAKTTNKQTASNVSLDYGKSVRFNELINKLNKNILRKSTISSETIDGVTTESRVVNVSPSLAEGLILNNQLNRPVTNTNVVKLATAMQNGEWVYDGTSITFDDDGNLLNGQHRLLAVISSGKTLPFKISTGYKATIFSTMDIGKIRTGSEVLAIAGVPNHKVCAGTANFLYKFLTRGSIARNNNQASNNQRHSTGLSHPELLKFVEQKPLLGESVSFYIEIKKIQQMALLPSYLVAGMYYLLGTKDEADARTFLTKMLTGEGLALNSPILAMRNRLIRNKLDKNNTLIHSDMIKLIIMAWNKFRNGEKVTRLKTPSKLPVIK